MNTKISIMPKYRFRFYFRWPTANQNKVENILADCLEDAIYYIYNHTDYNGLVPIIADVINFPDELGFRQLEDEFAGGLFSIYKVEIGNPVAEYLEYPEIYHAINNVIVHKRGLEGKIRDSDKV